MVAQDKITLKADKRPVFSGIKLRDLSGSPVNIDILRLSQIEWRD